MKYRRFSTKTWQDPWFEDLSPKSKLLFIYLFTNNECNQAGLYRISKRRIEFETSLKLNDFIGELSDKVVWNEKLNVIWVKNFFKWQSQNESFSQSAEKEARNIPEYYKAWCEYNGIQPDTTVVSQCHHSVPTVPSSETVTETVTETEEEGVVDNRRAPRKRSPSPRELLEIWNETATNLPKVRDLTSKRERKARQRLKERSLEDHRAIIAKANQTDFLIGNNDRGWKASFDWYIRGPDQAVRILEGVYENNNSGKWDQDKYFEKLLGGEGG